MKAHPYLHLTWTAFRTYQYTSVSLTSDTRASTISIRALSGLPSDNKTVMIANTRRTGEARGIYYRAKGPLVCLSGWLAVHQYYYCCCCHGPPQQSLAELLKPAPGPQPAVCLLYTINLCSLEMVQGCRELHGITAPLACQATVTVKWVRVVGRSEEWMEGEDEEGALEDMRGIGIWLYKAPWG